MLLFPEIFLKKIQMDIENNWLPKDACWIPHLSSPWQITHSSLSFPKHVQYSDSKEEEEEEEGGSWPRVRPRRRRGNNPLSSTFERHLTILLVFPTRFSFRVPLLTSCKELPLWNNILNYWQLYSFFFLVCEISRKHIYSKYEDYTAMWLNFRKFYFFVLLFLKKTLNFIFLLFPLFFLTVVTYCSFQFLKGLPSPPPLFPPLEILKCVTLTCAISQSMRRRRRGGFYFQI